MKKFKQGFSLMLVFFFTFFSILSYSPANASAKSKSKKKVVTRSSKKVSKKSTKKVVKQVQVVASGVKNQYTKGEKAQINLSYRNASAVYYRVFVKNIPANKVFDLRGYSKNQKGQCLAKVDLPTNYLGKNDIYIFSRTSTKSNYTLLKTMTYTVVDNKVVDTKVVIDKVGQNIGSKDEKNPQIVNSDVLLKVANGAYSNINIKGDLYLQADNILLNNVNVAGRVFVNPGEKGSATLNNLTAAEVKILSGGTESIHFNNAKITKNLSVESTSPVRVEIKGTTSINSTTVSSNAILENISGSFGAVNVKGNKTAAQAVEFRGTFDSSITVQGQATLKAALNAVLPKVVVSTTSDATITFEGKGIKDIEVNSKVNIVLEAGTNVNVVATVKGVNMQAEKGSEYSIKPNGNDVKVTGAGKNTSTTTTTGGGGGGGGSTSNNNPPVNPPATIYTNQSLDSFIYPILDQLKEHKKITDNVELIYNQNDKNKTVETFGVKVKDTAFTQETFAQAWKLNKGDLNDKSFQKNLAVNLFLASSNITIDSKNLGDYINSKTNNLLSGDIIAVLKTEGTARKLIDVAKGVKLSQVKLYDLTVDSIVVNEKSFGPNSTVAEVITAIGYSKDTKMINFPNKSAVVILKGTSQNYRYYINVTK